METAETETQNCKTNSFETINFETGNGEIVIFETENGNRQNGPFWSTKQQKQQQKQRQLHSSSIRIRPGGNIEGTPSSNREKWTWEGFYKARPWISKFKKIQKQNKNLHFSRSTNELKQNIKKTFQKYKWPLIDVTRKSVEETAASIIKIHEIYSNNVK